jgi:hypothetical protein
MVVVVGGPGKLVDAAKKAAAVEAGAIVVACELNDAATTAAKNRPFALVVSQEVYDFDAAEFDALARDVNATAIVVPAREATKDELQRQLMPAIKEAFEHSGLKK